MDGIHSLTCVAPINIALVKYWGKSNEDFNIPLNSSISVSLHTEDLCTKSTICVSESFVKDEMWLNGKKQQVARNTRIQRCLKEVRRSDLKRNKDDDLASNSPKCHIASVNNFPTSAGLASSASGYACLAKCLGTIYSSNLDLSILARLGSGSACRSIYGGFVKWEKGLCSFGSDSKAIQIAPESHWSNLKVLILVVSNKQKSVGSTEAMSRSVNTSELLKYRVKNCVSKRLELMEKAILEKDFKTFAILTMKDSNQLHSICQDTYPPISPPYMNDISHKIVYLISTYNETEIKAAYTFDAGSNAVLFTLEEHFDELLGTILKYFPANINNPNFINISPKKLESISANAININGMNECVGGLESIICTKPGPGAHISSESSLLDPFGNIA